MCQLSGELCFDSDLCFAFTSLLPTLHLKDDLSYFSIDVYDGIRPLSFSDVQAKIDHLSGW